MSANKRAGALYEQMFICESLSRGLDVAATIGDYSQYDCIVDNGRKLFRVQVKGTACKQSKTGYSITVGMGARSSEKKHYSDDAWDYLAALVLKNGERFWYIIPRSQIKRQLPIKLFPHPQSKARWEKYRHGWDLIC